MSRFRAVLLATSALASAGFAEQAQATVVSNDFVVLETLCGSSCSAPSLLSSSGSTTGPYTGSFTVENFSSNYQITGFDVGITPALGDGTTDPGWTATRALVDFGSGAVPAFVFNAVPSADIGPGGTLSGFYFWSQTAGSPVTIFATLNGIPTSCTTVTGTPGCDPPTGVPEPGTLSLLAMGLAVLGGLLWWRRQPVQSSPSDNSPPSLTDLGDGLGYASD
jgi:hypothetical protein